MEHVIAKAEIGALRSIQEKIIGRRDDLKLRNTEREQRVAEADLILAMIQDEIEKRGSF